MGQKESNEVTQEERPGVVILNGGGSSVRDNLSHEGTAGQRPKS